MLDEQIHEGYPNEESSSLRWRLLDILLISTAMILFFLGAALGIEYFLGLDQASEITLLTSIGLAALEGIVLIGSVYFLGIRRRGLPWRAVGLRATSRSWIILGILFGLLAIPMSALITVGIQLVLGRPIENTQLPFLAPQGFSWLGAISMFLLAGLLAPFAEELYFRGVLYEWIRQQWGIWPGIIISSLIFGAVHGEISVAGSAFFLGIMLAWIYERSGSLWVSVIVHAINNSVKILLLYGLLALSQSV